MSTKKTFTFPQSEQQMQTHRLTIPQLSKIINTTAKNGSVRIVSQNNDEIVLEFSGGRGETNQQYVPGDQKFVTEQEYRLYNQGGYSGTLQKYYSGNTGFMSPKSVADQFLRDFLRTNKTDIELTGPFSESDLWYFRRYMYQGTVSKPGYYITGTTYYTYSVEIEYVNNEAPVISGEDVHLGAKNDSFDVSYQVTDQSQDSIKVIERLNGTTIRSIDNAPKGEVLTISISREKLFSLPLDSENTIEISADDGKGGISYRRYTFQRTNSAPQISGNDQDLGEKMQPFSISFSATDQENDAMSAKLYLDDKLLKTYETLPSAEEQSYEISKLDFVQLNSTEPHKIRIEVRDKNAATSIRNLTFTRRVGRLRYQLTKETDQMAKQIIISPTWFIAEGAIAKVEVCNNAMDEHPTWENATEQVLQDRQFNFTNQTKTAEKWAVGVQITIERGEATETSWLAGFGGAYK